MAGLLYQNSLTRCRGWINPNDLYFGPQIAGLSSYYSPAASTSLVSIKGLNFFSYSNVRFSTYSPNVYFINSTQLDFYVPSTLPAGTYTVQVFNGSNGSNIVNYTIDNASGNWMINPNQTITNSNPAGLFVNGTFSRGAPYTIPTNETVYVCDSRKNSLNQIIYDNWLICDPPQLNYLTIQLPSASQYVGRELMFKNGSNYNVDNNPVILLSNNDKSGELFLAGFIGASITLVSDGTSWVAMQSSGRSI